MKKLLLIASLVAVSLFAKVDINSADKKELMTLKGIGDKTADSIIAYRKKSCFKSLNDLTGVKGIGEKTIAKNKKDITVGKCKK